MALRSGEGSAGDGRDGNRRQVDRGERASVIKEATAVIRP